MYITSANLHITSYFIKRIICKCNTIHCYCSNEYSNNTLKSNDPNTDHIDT